MRAYRFLYDNLFKTGLLAENPESVSQVGFVKLQNLKPWNEVLRYVEPYDVRSVASNKTQTFTIGTHTLNCSDTKLFHYEGGAFVEKASFAAVDNTWSCADFMKFGILSNGTNYIYIDANGASIAKPFDAQLPRSKSLCDLNGQLILGGMLGDWNSLDETFVAWSRIGAVDFAVDKSNEVGFFCPNIGKVKTVLPLGKSFAALGDSGVAIFNPEEQTFGYNRISDFGITSSLQAASTGDEVYFIDRRGLLCKIGATAYTERSAVKVQLLGYSWLFAGKECKMHWCGADSELRIVVDNQRTYILNQFGMYETNLVILGSALVGTSVICSVFGSTDQSEAILETSTDDSGIAGLKTMSEVYIADSSAGEHFLSIYASRDKVEVLSRERKVNSFGTVTPNIAGERHRLRYRTPNYIAGTVSSINVQTMRTDRRYSKGFVQQQLPTGE